MRLSRRSRVSGPSAAAVECVAPPTTWATVLVAILTLVLWAGPVESARAAEAFFPGLPPATQVTRNLTLAQAAQDGLIKLQAKGGSEGDAVSLELQDKQVRGPITVTLRVELTVKPRMTPAERTAIRDLVPYLQTQTEAELNRGQYKTRSGDPLRFVLDYKYREPEESARSNYHQVLVVDPKIDLAEPDPNFRSEVDELGVPNKTDASKAGTFGTNDLVPSALGHELLHLAGLDDRYTDVYTVGGKDYPLPHPGLTPSELRTFALDHKPPLPPPPAGRDRSKNTRGTSACDVMGTGLYRQCRRIAPRDIAWLASQAGVQVVAQPGDLLLDKDPSRQNFGVGFRTTVFATPGSTTVANGIAVYCLDHTLSYPLDQGFDVGPAGSELPGYDGVVRLLQLNANLQPELNAPLTGMQAAIWNLTDATPLDSSGTADESRALMAQAGVAENSVPGGLPQLPDPNSGVPATGTVDASGAVMPTIATVKTKPAQLVRFDTAALFPNRVHAGRNVRSDLLVGASGDVNRLALRVERRAGRRWRPLRSLVPRPLAPGRTIVPLGLGRLSAGDYRLILTVGGPLGAPVVKRVAFTVQA